MTGRTGRCQVGPRQPGVLAAIGRTPLVELRRLCGQRGLRVFAKLEGLNPSGSSKDRPAAAIINEAMSDATITRDSTVIESSSGNFALGLAQACKYHGLALVCVVDPNTPRRAVAILEAFGATIIEVTDPDPSSGEFLHARLERVRELVDSTPGGFWPNQYANVTGASSHAETMREIHEHLCDTHIDYLFCATSTCGTLRGCADYLHEHSPGTEVVAVDAAGSAIFDRPAPRRRRIPGHGAAVRPALLHPGLADHVVRVDDFECVVGCRSLLDREAIFAGGSSGAVAVGLQYLASQLPDEATVVLILPDRGDGYLTTIFEDEWVLEQFGRLPQRSDTRILGWE